MRVLVTGGTGFVGYAVTKDLVQHGHEVTVLTRRVPAQPIPAGTSSTACADIRDRTKLTEALSSQAFEGVCHLAGLVQLRSSFRQPLAYFDANVAGTLNLLYALGESQSTAPRVVFGSTGAIYGREAEGRLTEEQPGRPDNPYASSKFAAEQLLLHHAATGAIGATVLRCFTIGGACDGVGDRDETRLLPNALRVATGQAPSLSVNGDGSAVREYTHVLDVATAYRLALVSTEPGTRRLYNVGSGDGVSVAELVDAVVDVTGRAVPMEHRPPQPEPHLLVADSTRIRADLGWSSPHSSLREIVQDSYGAARTALGVS